MPSWDLIILLFFAANIIYGFLLRRDSLVILIVSTYISYVATIAGGSLFSTVINRVLPKTSISESFSETIIFFTLIILLNLWGEYGADTFSFGRSGASFILTAFYGILSAGLIIASFVSLLPQDIQSNLLANSNILQKVLKLEILWFLLPVLSMIVAGFFGERKAR